MEEPRGAAAAAAKLLQSCPTLCDPIDGSPPDSPGKREVLANTVSGESQLAGAEPLSPHCALMWRKV